MDGSEFGKHGEAGAQGVWWMRRVHPIDGMVLLMAVATALFAAMLMVHFASSLQGGM